VAHEVNLNPKAAKLLEGLHKSDPSLADLIEDVLDALESDPRSFEHEPWPTEHGAVFLTHVLGTDWFVAWVYGREPDMVIVGFMGHV
jgi:hypothetical protein